MDHNDKLENAIRDILEQHEAEYEPAAWTKMEAALGAAAVGSTATGLSMKTGLIAAGATLLLGGSVLLYSLFYLDTEELAEGTPTNDATATEVEQPDQDAASAAGTIDFEEAVSNAAAEADGDATASDTDAENSALADNTAKDSEAADAAGEDDANNEAAAALAEEDAEASGASIAVSSQFVIPDLMEGKYICPSVEVDFKANNVAPATYFWQFGDGTTSRKRNPAHAYTMPGTYDVSLTVKHKITGKVKTTTMNDLVMVKPGIQARWSWKEGNPLIHDPSLQWSVESPDAVAWSWQFGEERTTTERSPVHMFVEQGSHEVALIVENKFQCADTLRKPVVMKRDYDLFAPKSFSPNADGVNDTWIPLALKLSDRAFTLSIVDAKTGAIVFTSKEPNKPWNGAYKSGTGSANPGQIYYWVAEVEGYGGNIKEFAGMITIGK